MPEHASPLLVHDVTNHPDFSPNDKLETVIFQHFQS